MTRAGRSRLVAVIEGLIEEATRATGRELKTALRSIRNDIQTDMRRLERRVEKLERQLARLGSRKDGRQKTTLACKRDGCQEPALARGLCSRHYQQMRYRKNKTRSRRRKS